VNAAVLCFGLAGVLGALTGLPSPLIVLGRVVTAGTALAVVAAWRRVDARPKERRDGVVLALQGVLLAVHWTTFFQSIEVSNVAIGLLSFSSFPLFTVALEGGVLRERVSRVQLAAALLVIPGVFLLVPRFSLQSSATAGVLWGLAAGATFALLSVTNRRLTRRYASLTISLYQDAVAALALLPTLLLYPNAGALLTPRVAALLLALGLVCTALAHTLFIAGMRTVTAQLASLLASLEPVWGIVFALLLLGQVPSGRTLAGGAVIVGATLLPAVRRRGLTAENAEVAEKTQRGRD
jgi:drug/metabolite transporter (DMT)-like permease